MKYPKKYEGEKTELKFPVFDSLKDKWFCCKLFKDGTIEKILFTNYDKEHQCWRPCLAYNRRVGYTEKEVSKLIKKYYVEKGQKKQKKKKAKSKKKKKNKS